MIKRHALSQEEAEIIGLQVLAFIASDPALLERFTSTTGISGSDLRQRADSPEILGACLAELRKNDSDLLMFCSNANLEPEYIVEAESMLEGTPRDEQ